MKVVAQPHGNVMVFVLNGPLVTDELPDVRRALETTAPGVNKRVLDMSGVPYLDSAGIEWVIDACGLHRSGPQRVKLAALTETCRDALELTDALPRIDAFDTVENAIRGWHR